MNRWLVVGCVGTGLLFGAGCTKEKTDAAAAPKPAEVKQAVKPAEAAVAFTPADQGEAKDIFASRCFTCHGASGAGDGPGSGGLDPKPRDLRSKEWQTSVDDAHIEKIIKLGGPGVGKSPAMPPNPDLESKPGVVAALRAHVRSLGNQ